MQSRVSMPARDVLITGIGIVTSLGEGVAVHAGALDGFTQNVDRERFAPYAVHPAAAVEMDRQHPQESPTSARWSPGSATARGRRARRSRMRA